SACLRCSRILPSSVRTSLMAMSGLCIDLSGILDHGVGDLPAVAVQATIEAAFATGVTGNAADLLHLVAHGVTIAVEQNIVQLLYMTGFFALSPQLAA